MANGMLGVGAALQSIGGSMQNYQQQQFQREQFAEEKKQRALQMALQQKQLEQSMKAQEEARADREASRVFQSYQNLGPTSVSEAEFGRVSKVAPELTPHFGGPTTRNIFEGAAPLPEGAQGPPMPTGSEAVREFRGFEPPGYRSATERERRLAEDQLADARHQAMMGQIAQGRLGLEQQRTQAALEAEQRRSRESQIQAARARIALARVTGNTEDEKAARGILEGLGGGEDIIEYGDLFQPTESTASTPAPAPTGNWFTNMFRPRR